MPLETPLWVAYFADAASKMETAKPTDYQTSSCVAFAVLVHENHPQWALFVDEKSDCRHIHSRPSTPAGNDDECDEEIPRVVDADPQP